MIKSTSLKPQAFFERIRVRMGKLWLHFRGAQNDMNEISKEVSYMYDLDFETGSFIS